jgi:hypothetical protein
MPEVPIASPLYNQQTSWHQSLLPRSHWFLHCDILTLQFIFFLSCTFEYIHLSFPKNYYAYLHFGSHFCSEIRISSLLGQQVNLNKFSKKN